MDEQLALAAEFPATSEADWRKLVEAALKGASFDKRLVSQTYDGLRVEPLYPRAADAKPVAGRAPGAAWTDHAARRSPRPELRRTRRRLLDLENGAGGLTLVFAGSLNANGYGLDASPETIARALDGVELDAGITIDFNLSPPTRVAVDHVAALVESAQARSRPPSICVAASIRSAALPPRARARSHGANCRGFLPPRCASLADQGFRGPFVVADGRIIHNAGGSEAQELGLRPLRRGRLPARAGQQRRHARCRALA